MMKQNINNRENKTEYKPFKRSIKLIKFQLGLSIKRHKTKINGIRNKRGAIITDPTDIKRNIRNKFMQIKLIPQRNWKILEEGEAQRTEHWKF